MEINGGRWGEVGEKEGFIKREDTVSGRMHWKKIYTFLPDFRN